MRGAKAAVLGVIKRTKSWLVRPCCTALFERFNR